MIETIVRVFGGLAPYLGLTSVLGKVMSVLSCLCETISMIMSCLIYRRLRVVTGLKPLSVALSRQDVRLEDGQEFIEMDEVS